MKVAAVEHQARRCRVREGVRRDPVAPADLERIDARRRRDDVEDPLHHQRRSLLAERARARTTGDLLVTTIRVVDAAHRHRVAGRERERADERHAPAGAGGDGAVVGDQRAVHGEHAPVRVVGGALALMLLLAGGEHALLARSRPT